MQLKPGIEGNGVAEAKVNFVGEGKFELPAKQGEALTILCEQGCPPGKWLVKNEDGHCKFILNCFNNWRTILNLSKVARALNNKGIQLYSMHMDKM